MAADDLEMQGAKSSAVMVLTVWDEKFLDFHNEGFQHTVKSLI